MNTGVINYLVSVVEPGISIFPADFEKALAVPMSTSPREEAESAIEQVMTQAHGMGIRVQFVSLHWDECQWLGEVRVTSDSGVLADALVLNTSRQK